MKKKLGVISLLLSLTTAACWVTHRACQAPFLGNFQEKPYDFMCCFAHLSEPNQFAEAAYAWKYGPNPSSETRYTWLREPENLIRAFATAQAIGLDLFVSRAAYVNSDYAWCCDTQWEGKSPADLVGEFLASDTAATDTGYYAQFWQRRRAEGNLREVYWIIQQVDAFYAEDRTTPVGVIDSALHDLWRTNLSWLDADSTQYREATLAYFDALQQAGLHFSAYKLIAHHEDLDLSAAWRDSLIRQLSYDTLSRAAWEQSGENYEGWIYPTDFPDPKRYYGP